MRASNSLDPGQARPFVGPGLGPNCLQRISAVDSNRQRVNHLILIWKLLIYQSVSILYKLLMTLHVKEAKNKRLDYAMKVLINTDIVFSRCCSLQNMKYICVTCTY